MIKECRFLIPIYRNSVRSLHQPYSWNSLENVIRKYFPKGKSGPNTYLHINSELIPGEYENVNGLKVYDESRAYTIALPDNQIEILRELLSAASNTFDQDTIYLSVAGIVEFIPKNSEGKTLLDF